MEHLAFFVGAAIMVTICGGPLVNASIRDAHSYREWVAAPVIGICVLAVVVTVGFTQNVAPVVSAVIATTVAAIWLGVQLSVQTGAFVAPGRVDLAIRAGCVVVIATLILLPHFIGGASFVIYQGNPHDTFNYLSGAFGFGNYSFLELTSNSAALEWSAGLREAGNMLTARPTVSILYAAFYRLFSSDFVVNAYEYLLLAQLTYYFAFVYALDHAFPGRHRIWHVIAAAFCVSFFVQYILDINAWSQLFAVPIMLVVLTDYCRLLTSQFRTADAAEAKVAAPMFKWVFTCVRLPVLGSGLLYLYPEIVTVTVLACSSALLFSIALQIAGDDWKAVANTFGLSALAAVIAFLIACAYWRGTISFLLSQLSFATTTSVPWHHFFHPFYFGGTSAVLERLQASDTASFLFYVLVAAPASFLAGVFGVYFLQPSGIWRAPLNAGKICWAGTLLALMLTLCIGIVRSGQAEFRRWLASDRRTIFGVAAAGAVVTFVIPLVLLVKGQYWAAGKAMSMLAPFVFAALVLPIVNLQLRAAWLISIGLIAAQFAFGVARPVTTALGGHYAYPYLTAGPTKQGLDWDIPARAAQLRTCTLIEIDIRNEFLKRLVENFVIEQRISWFSLNVGTSYYGDGVALPLKYPPPGVRADCLMTDQKADRGDGVRVFNFVR